MTIIVVINTFISNLIYLKSIIYNVRSKLVVLYKTDNIHTYIHIQLWNNTHASNFVSKLVKIYENS